MTSSVFISLDYTYIQAWHFVSKRTQFQELGGAIELPCSCTVPYCNPAAGVGSGFLCGPWLDPKDLRSRGGLKNATGVKPIFNISCHAYLAAHVTSPYLSTSQFSTSALAKPTWWFPKIGVPPNHHFFLNEVFHSQPSILGYPHSWNPPPPHVIRRLDPTNDIGPPPRPAMLGSYPGGKPQQGGPPALSQLSHGYPPGRWAPCGMVGWGSSIWPQDGG